MADRILDTTAPEDEAAYWEWRTVLELTARRAVEADRDRSHDEIRSLRSRLGAAAKREQRLCQQLARVVRDLERARQANITLWHMIEEERDQRAVAALGPFEAMIAARRHERARH